MDSNVDSTTANDGVSVVQQPGSFTGLLNSLVSEADLALARLPPKVVVKEENKDEDHLVDEEDHGEEKLYSDDKWTHMAIETGASGPANTVKFNAARRADRPSAYDEVVVEPDDPERWWIKNGRFVGTARPTGKPKKTKAQLARIARRAANREATDNDGGEAAKKKARGPLMTHLLPIIPNPSYKCHWNQAGPLQLVSPKDVVCQNCIDHHNPQRAQLGDPPTEKNVRRYVNTDALHKHIREYHVEGKGVGVEGPTHPDVELSPWIMEMSGKCHLAVYEGPAVPVGQAEAAKKYGWIPAFPVNLDPAELTAGYDGAGIAVPSAQKNINPTTGPGSEEYLTKAKKNDDETRDFYSLRGENIERRPNDMRDPTAKRTWIKKLEKKQEEDSHALDTDEEYARWIAHKDRREKEARERKLRRLEPERIEREMVENELMSYYHEEAIEMDGNTEVQVEQQHVELEEGELVSPGLFVPRMGFPGSSPNVEQAGFAGQESVSVDAVAQDHPDPVVQMAVPSYRQMRGSVSRLNPFVVSDDEDN